MMACPRRLRSWIRTATPPFLAFALVACNGDDRRDPSPTIRNVLLVTLDTTRADRIGAFGGTAVPTPNLDRAASEGTRFLQAISPVPLTLPAHTSIFTGLYPFRHGVRHNGAFRVPPSAVTLAERFREAGFRTGAFVGAFVLDASFGLEQGFETYSGVATGAPAVDFLRPSDLQRPAGEVNASAHRWIESVEGERFFAWIHYYDPHDPYSPPEDPAVRLQGSGYDREISYVDHCFGELIGSLQRKGLLEHTMIIVVGDHGESLGSHGELKHGIFLYEPAVHVPFFVRAPGLVRSGQRYESPVSLVDVAPTVLSLLRLSPLQGVDGKSLWTPSGQLVAEQADRLVYGETLMPRIELGWSDLAMARDGRFKYVRAPRPELYDLSKDPAETRNLVDANPGAASDFSDALDLKLSVSTDGTGDGAARVLSPEELAKLQSLGYLQGSVTSKTGMAGGSLPDPKDCIGEASRLDEAEQHLERNELDAAIAKYESVSRENGRNHTALQGRARALLRKGDVERAEEAALAALAAAGSDPQSPAALADNARALLATTLSLEGRRAEAEKALRSPATTAPLSPTRVLMAAAKNQDDAKAIVQMAIQKFPRDPWAWAAMLAFSRRVGEKGGVENARHKLLVLGAPAASALVDAGQRAQDANDVGLAISLFETALEVRPQHPDVLGYLGTARLAAGDLTGAENAFLGVRRLRPEDPRVPMYLANIALLRGDEAKARALIDEALRKAPQFVPPLLNYARWLGERGRTAEAIQVAQSAITRRPGDATAEALLYELRSREGHESR